MSVRICSQLSVFYLLNNSSTVSTKRIFPLHYKSTYKYDEQSIDMGICEDVGLGTCDAVFIFFLIEMSLLALILICCCMIPFCALCNLAVKEASKTDEEIAEEKESWERTRRQALAVRKMYESIDENLKRSASQGV